MKLTEHFRWSEFDCRDGTAAPAGYREQLPSLCRKYLEPLRKMFGPVHVVSGFRTRSHNASVGGARGSFHLYVPGRQGVAADVICRSGRPSEWYEFLDSLQPGGLGRYSSFVHVDSRPARSRW